MATYSRQQRPLLLLYTRHEKPHEQSAFAQKFAKANFKITLKFKLNLS